MEFQKNESENSDKPKTRPQMLNILKSPKKCVPSVPQPNESIETSNYSPSILSSPHFEHKHNLPLELRSSTPNAPTVDFSFTSLTNSSPNLRSNNSAAPRFKVLRLLSRLTSIIRPSPLNCIDEEVLNKFNLEVGTVASRVDLWRQRLEDERTNTVRYNSCSVEIGSSPGSTPPNQTHTFIRDEINHLVTQVRDLASLLLGSFGLGLLGMEEKLMVLLEMGSNMVYPVAENLIVHIWRMLREILDLHEDDTDKSGRIFLVIDAISNAFDAIRSLIHLGKAYSDAHEPSDSDYTGENSRLLLERSFTNFDLKP